MSGGAGAARRRDGVDGVDGVMTRPRTAADLDAVVDVLRAVHRHDAYPSAWPPDPAAWVDPPGTAAAWVGVDGGRVAAHACAFVGAGEPSVTALTGVPRARLATVKRLFVDPAARRRGLASALLREVRAWAAGAGLAVVLDVVDDDGPAVRAYERLGWQLVERRPADWVTAAGERLPVRVYLAPDPLPAHYAKRDGSPAPSRSTSG